VGALATWKAEQARVWGSAAWQRIAEGVLSPLHAELVRRLDPKRGERWLDVATGTGAVALRAASAGAQVTAQDLAPGLVADAQRLAAEQDLGISFDVGDAEQLPYPAASLDVVSSAQGVIFAADHAAVACEIARVCRPGGRVGLTCWLPNPGLDELMQRIPAPRPADADRPGDWGRPDYARGLLARHFDVQFADAICPWWAASGEAAWIRLITCDGIAQAGVATLASRDRDALHRDWVDYFERHRVGGNVSVPRPYRLILGRRRGGRT
jgi:SAM-dependent methyltransferase